MIVEHDGSCVFDSTQGMDDFDSVQDIKKHIERNRNIPAGS